MSPKPAEAFSMMYTKENFKRMMESLEQRDLYSKEYEQVFTEEPDTDGFRPNKNGREYSRSSHSHDDMVDSMGYATKDFAMKHGFMEGPTGPIPPPWEPPRKPSHYLIEFEDE